MCEKKEILIHWIQKHYQLSEALSKKGAPYQTITDTIQRSKL